MGAKGFLSAVLIIFLAASAAFTAEEVATQPSSPPDTTGPLITDTAVPQEPGRFTLQPFWSLSFMGGNFSANWRRQSARGDFVVFNLPVKLTYGLARNLEVYAVVPYAHNWGSHGEKPGPKGERAADFGGLGDISLSLKYQLLKETPWRPTVTGLFSVDFPTGHRYNLNPGRLETDALGAGAFAFTAGANLSKWLGPVCLYGNLWYSVAANPPPSAGPPPVRAAAGSGARPGPGHREPGRGGGPDPPLGGPAGVLQHLGGGAGVRALPGAPQRPYGGRARARVHLQPSLVLRPGGSPGPGRQKQPLCLHPHLFGAL